jgi:hypothetical protein
MELGTGEYCASVMAELATKGGVGEAGWAIARTLEIEN